MTRVLVVSHDLVRRSMAGPGIRNYELARQLAGAGHRVTLATPGETDLADPLLTMTPFDDAVLRRLAPDSDVVMGQGWVFSVHPVLCDGPWRVVVDLYDPFHLESLVAVETSPLDDQREQHLGRLGVLVRQLQGGDFFLCASERQRDFWLGMLSAVNRVNPDTHRADPGLRALVDVVPFGIPAAPPEAQPGALRATVPGIGPDDLVVLWGGGLYDWFDPLTLVRGIAEAAPDLPRVRLVFHSGRHPNPSVGEMGIVARTRGLAEELGLLGRHVFFNDSWVPYAERARYLLDADIGVSTHVPHLETRYSFRTRILDYLWAGLPVLSTEGDVLGDLCAARGWGRTVPPGSPAAIAAALRELAAGEVRAECSRRIAIAAPGLTWAHAAQPLLRYCADPLRAPDLGRLARGARMPVPLPGPEPAPAPAGPPPWAPRRLASLVMREGPLGAARVVGRCLLSRR